MFSIAVQFYYDFMTLCVLSYHNLQVYNYTILGIKTHQFFFYHDFYNTLIELRILIETDT